MTYVPSRWAKNWIFKGSPRGAKAGAIFYMLITTAKHNHIEPYAYLRYILNKVANCEKPDDYQKLLPWNISSAQLATD